MNIYQFLKCLTGNHHRDGRSVRSKANIDFARCKGCGRPMIRDKGPWRLDTRRSAERGE